MIMLYDFFASAFWFLVVVGVLVFLHEAGHFLTAKLFGMRVDVFSLGFGRRLLGFRRKDTDYRLSVIPLGGYVKLTGGEEAGEAEDPIPPDYFLARPRWQRFLVLVMGATVNILLAVVLFASSFLVGVDLPGPVLPIVLEVKDGSPAVAAGLAPGDKILTMNGRKLKEWKDLISVLIEGGKRPVQLEVERAGATFSTSLTPAFDKDGNPDMGARLAEPVMVSMVQPDMPAARAGLERNDRIVAIDGQPVLNSGEVIERIGAAAGRAVLLGIQRAGRALDVEVTPATVSEGGKEVGRIGIGLSLLEHVHLGPGPALRRALETSWELAGSLFHVLRNLVTLNQPFSTLSGPIGIAKVSQESAEQGAGSLLFWMAFISLQLGIINLLPIPVLDGGHIFILGTEGVLRRDLSLQVKERLNQAGFIALVALMVAVVAQDLFKAFR